MKKTLKIFGQYKKSQGFTLIEMSVVLLIIGILSAIILRGIGSQPVQARDSRRISDLRTLAIYLAQYMTKMGQFPTSSDKAASSTWSWSTLNNSFSSAGMAIYNLPVPPTKADDDAYIYYACNGGKNFILSAHLEQTYSAAPRVYEGTYDTTTPPWSDCKDPSGGPGGVTSIPCSSSNKNYCLVQ
jgi:prepilin-type N-terminal cleavage/methylation domain-containing protein